MTDPVPTEAVARVAFLPRGQLLPTVLGTSGCVEALIRVSADDDPGTVTVLFTGFATGAVEANEKAIREMAAVLIGILPEAPAEPKSIVCHDYPNCPLPHAGGAGGVPVHPPEGSRVSGDEPLIPEPEPRVRPVGRPLLCVVCMRMAHWVVDGTSYCRDCVPRRGPGA